MLFKTFRNGKYVKAYSLITIYGKEKWAIYIKGFICIIIIDKTRIPGTGIKT